MENKTNEEIRTAARESLSGNWGSAIFALLVLTVAMQLASLVTAIPVLGFLAWISLAILLTYGAEIYGLRVARDREFMLDNLFCGFKDALPKLTTMLLATLYTILWSLLFIIPGIIKLYSYAMVSYIVEEQGLSNNEAIEESMRLMEGHKMRLFLMNLHFGVLALLSALTLFIGLLWLAPYIRVTMGHFYLDLKANDRAAIDPISIAEKAE
ncbi:MAG: DUF975 family protein [Rikenellaceae bacterium]